MLRLQWLPVSRKQILMMLLLLPLGCATRGYGAVSIASTHRQAVSARVLAQKVEGSDCRSGFFLLENEIGNYEVAVQKAISSAPGADALLDASVEFVSYDFLVYRKGCIRVSGSAAVFE